MYSAEDRHGFGTFSFNNYIYNLPEVLEKYQKKIKRLENENKILEHRLGEKDVDEDYMSCNYIDGHWCIAVVRDIRLINNDDKISLEATKICYEDVKTGEVIAVRHSEKQNSREANFV